MRIIPLLGLFPADLINTRCALLFPGAEEEARRRQYYAADLANGTFYEPGPEIICWQVDQLQALLEAPSWQELRREATERTKRALLAGYIFTFMFLLRLLQDRLPNRGEKGASLAKAKFIVREWALQEGVYGDGTPIPTSEKFIRDCWNDYRDVAHLWAAMEMNRVAEYAPFRQILHPAYADKFFETAAYLQEFGLAHRLRNKAAKVQDTLLNPHTCWRIDIERYRPRILLPVDPAVFDDAPFMPILRRYAA